MGLSSLSNARASTAFAWMRMEIQSMERLCLLGLENLNVAFQVSLKLVYVRVSLGSILLGHNSPNMQILIPVLNDLYLSIFKYVKIRCPPVRKNTRKLCNSQPHRSGLFHRANAMADLKRFSAFESQVNVGV